MSALKKKYRPFAGWNNKDLNQRQEVIWEYQVQNSPSSEKTSCNDQLFLATESKNLWSEQIGQHLNASKKLFSKEYYHFNLYQHEMGHKREYEFVWHL